MKKTPKSTSSKKSSTPAVVVDSSAAFAPKARVLIKKIKAKLNELKAAAAAPKKSPPAKKKAVKASAGKARKVAAK